MDNNELKMEIEKIKERNKKVELVGNKFCKKTLYMYINICSCCNIFNNHKKRYKYMDQFFGTSNRFYFINIIFKNNKKNMGEKK